ncbi:MAG: asparagine synthase-related protein, partial [Acidaminococcaceae bacterium]
MGAICGIYYKDKSANVRECEQVMLEIGKYRFEKSGTFHDGAIILGCQHNCLTPESINEILPFEDDAGTLVITADAIIDNREELFALLSVPIEKTNMPDSLVILEAYKKWGVHCPDKLVGDFAFAIWDKKKQELFCARDHVGRKSFYYYNDKEVFAFSTLIKPLFQIEDIKQELNETYIADFLAMTDIRHEIGSDITLYENIYQLLPAHAMIVNRSGIRKWRYWEIKKTKEIKFESDAEYEEAFRKVFAEAVRCRLRSIKRTGILLSGGLDSCSVACLAAEELRKKNEKLYSFTQVPMEGYKNWLPDNQLADEQEYVESISRFTGNIEPYYIASEGKSPITEINESIARFEQPYKCFANIYWI